MEKRLRKMTIGKLLGDDGVFGTWNRPDGIALVVAQGTDGIGLSNFLEASEELEWGADNDDFVRQLAVTLGRLAAGAGVELGELTEFIEEGFEEWEFVSPDEDDAGDFDDDTDMGDEE